MLLTMAVLSCSLVDLSNGCIAEPGSLVANYKLTMRSKRPAVASGLNGRSTVFSGGGGGGGGESSSLGAARSHERLFETATALRGGSLAEKIPGLDAAASALAGISAPDIAWTGGPALFAQVTGRSHLT